MNVLGLIGQIFKPAMEMIDNVHTSAEEKLVQKAQLLELQTTFLTQALDYESEQLKSKTAIIMAEANSASWLARNWLRTETDMVPPVPNATHPAEPPYTRRQATGS